MSAVVHPPRRRRDAGPRTWVRLGLAAVAILVGAVIVWSYRDLAVDVVDLEVYRDGASRILAGEPLYPPGSRYAPDQPLPFTYPPIAAIFAIPLSWLTLGSATALWRLLSFAALWVLVAAGFDRLVAPLSRVGATGAVALITLASLGLAPVFYLFGLGQVGLVLAAACLIGLRRIAAGRRGGPLLIGLTVAVKLTPAAFGLLLLAARRWRDAVLVALVALAAWTLPALVIPGDVREWLDVGFDADRVGPVASPINLAWRGLVVRSLPESAVTTALWVALALVTLGIGAWRGARLLQAGEVATAATVVGIASVLASPIGWLHHAVWVVPAVGILIGSGRSWHRWIAAVLVAVIFSVPGMSRLVPPGTEVIAGPLDWLVVHASTIALAVLLVTLRPEGRCTQRADPVEAA